MREAEIDYYEQRAVEELERADATSDPVTAQVHRRLAILYRNKIAELRDQARVQNQS